MRKWVTRFVGDDRDLYAGPIILADCEAGAAAVLTCLQGPSGQRIDLMGELLAQSACDEDGNVEVTLGGKAKPGACRAFES